MTTRKSFAGAAAQTTLNGAIDATQTTALLTAGTTYPATAGGPFVICVSRGTATEEKILVGTRSGSTLSVCTRGYDGTTGQAHSSGAVVEHVLDSVTVDEANAISSAATTTGDMIYKTGTSTFGRIAVGTNGQGLVEIAGVPTWAAGYRTYASVATRDAEITSPTENMLAALADSNTLTVYSGAAWSTVGPLHGAWISWTPTFTIAVVGNGTLTGSYCRSGRMVMYRWKLIFGTTTTMGTSPTFTYPVTAVASTEGDTGHIGVASDATGPRVRLTSVADTTARCLMTYSATSGVLLIDNTITSAAPFTWAVNDFIQYSGHYEAAADA